MTDKITCRGCQKSKKIPPTSNVGEMMSQSGYKVVIRFPARKPLPLGRGGSAASNRSEIPKPYWPKWKCFQSYHLELREAVALSCNYEPDMLAYSVEEAINPDDDDEFKNYRERLWISEKVAGEAFSIRRIPERDRPDTILVYLGEFAAWTKNMQKESPDIWGALPTEFVAFAARKKR